MQLQYSVAVTAQLPEIVDFIASDRQFGTHAFHVAGAVLRAVAAGAGAHCSGWTGAVQCVRVCWQQIDTIAWMVMPPCRRFAQETSTRL